MIYEYNSNDYNRCHKRVNRAFGPATEQYCYECGVPADEWASQMNDHEDIDDYLPMCIPCHRSTDRRRKHDERQDHTYEPEPHLERTQCKPCRQRRANERNRKIYNTDEYRAWNRERMRPIMRERRARIKAEKRKLLHTQVIAAGMVQV